MRYPLELKPDTNGTVLVSFPDFPEAHTFGDDRADMIGRQVAAVVNFAPRLIGKFMSEILVLGFPDEAGEVVLVVPDQEVPNGGRMY